MLLLLLLVTATWCTHVLSHGQPLIRETAAARIAVVKKLIWSFPTFKKCSWILLHFLGVFFSKMGKKLSTFIGDSTYTRAPPNYRSPLRSNYTVIRKYSDSGILFIFLCFRVFRIFFLDEHKIISLDLPFFSVIKHFFSPPYTIAKNSRLKITYISVFST